MKPLMYTFGYSGPTNGSGWGPHVELLLRTTNNLNRKIRGRGVRWIDIRMKRSGRAEGFCSKREQYFNSRNYRWIEELGNESVVTKKSKIKLADPKRGYARLEEELHHAKKDNVDLILFCHCFNYLSCHRSHVVKNAPEDLNKAFYRNKYITDMHCPEWPPVGKPIRLSGRDMAISKSNILTIPVSMRIPNIGSPLNIGAWAYLIINDGEEETEAWAKKAVPSSDEKQARIFLYVGASE